MCDILCFIYLCIVTTSVLTKIASTNAYFKLIIWSLIIHININIYYNGFIPLNVWVAYEAQYFFTRLKGIYLCKLLKKFVQILFRL